MSSVWKWTVGNVEWSELTFNKPFKFKLMLLLSKYLNFMSKKPCYIISIVLVLCEFFWQHFEDRRGSLRSKTKGFVEDYLAIFRFYFPKEKILFCLSSPSLIHSSELCSLLISEEENLSEGLILHETWKYESLKTHNNKKVENANAYKCRLKFVLAALGFLKIWIQTLMWVWKFYSG